jgi:tRNA A-37 threonylcarbamoyl transferase component Bud32
MEGGMKVNGETYGFPFVLHSMSDDEIENIEVHELLNDTGSFSDVYNATYKCRDIVIKYIYAKGGTDIRIEDVEREICFLYYLKGSDISPEFHGFYKKDDGYVILLDKVKGYSGRSIIEKFNIERDYHGCVNLLLNALRKLLCLSLIYGICHGDFHTENFMKAGDDIYIFDFGLSTLRVKDASITYRDCAGVFSDYDEMNYQLYKLVISHKLCEESTWIGILSSSMTGNLKHIDEACDRVRQLLII